MISCNNQLLTRFQRCVAAMPGTASLKARVDGLQGRKEGLPSIDSVSVMVKTF